MPAQNNKFNYFLYRITNSSNLRCALVIYGFQAFSIPPLINTFDKWFYPTVCDKAGEIINKNFLWLILPCVLNLKTASA